MVNDKVERELLALKARRDLLIDAHVAQLTAIDKQIVDLQALQGKVNTNFENTLRALQRAGIDTRHE
jgi:hypothetical protein